MLFSFPWSCSCLQLSPRGSKESGSGNATPQKLKSKQPALARGTAKPARASGQRPHAASGSALPSSSAPSSSIEPALLQVVFNDNVCNGVEHKLHVLGVGGAGEVRVDLLGVFSPVQILKLTLDVGSCFLVRVGACEREDPLLWPTVHNREIF